MEEFHKKYKDKGLQVLGINVENQTISAGDETAIRKALRELAITFPVLPDRGLKVFHEFSIIVIPSTVVITGDTIAYELAGLPLVGTEDMFEYLRTLAGEPSTKKGEPRPGPRPDAVADTGLARGFARKGRLERAYPLLQKAMEKDPRYLLPNLEMAKLLMEEGKMAEAESTLKKAIAIEPDNPALLGESGYVQAKAGNYGAAIDTLNKVVEKDSFAPAYWYLGYALGMSGRMREALQAFEKGISSNPFEFSAFFLRAAMEEKSTMLKEAAADYRKAFELKLKIGR
ncbi:MAG: tetratricopeptide repeat protein [Alphaproteobacteria bacterium]|uniref:Tetratricopeptide repeat protein n=1 Tax=Candidatus Nitrobium versatile TaxID=2884831 RepID=A0A953M249_9BACT|nr:tetratricopeptide repeat protein [Candidatus Nitrobium versatile]